MPDLFKELFGSSSKTRRSTPANLSLSTIPRASTSHTRGDSMVNLVPGPIVEQDPAHTIHASSTDHIIPTSRRIMIAIQELSNGSWFQYLLSLYSHSMMRFRLMFAWILSHCWVLCNGNLKSSQQYKVEPMPSLT